VKAGLGDSFTLKPGQQAYVAPAGMTLEFAGVPEDSRCPTGVVCVWEGQAKVKVNARLDGRDAGDMEMVIRGGVVASVSLGALQLQLLALYPYPEAGKAIGSGDYRALFVVSLQKELASANVAFGFDLFAQLVRQDASKNLFISPISVSTALAMAYNGAAGETQRAMAEALRLQGLELPKVNQAYLALLNSLGGLNPEVEVSIANSIWGRKGILWNEGFLARNRTYYRAEVTSLDFDPAARDSINNWVSDKTKGKIKGVVDDIKQSDVMFLINAIYFNGTWLSPFDKKLTTDHTFHLAGGAEKLHPMMSQHGRFMYLKGDGFQAVKLPYKKPQVGMHVFLPDEGSSLEQFLKSVNGESWQSWMSRFSQAEGDVVLPRFKLEYKAELSSALTALGMGVAFTDQADLSGMVEPQTVLPGGLYIDSVLHKAVVDVNEEGTEAAAVTSVVVGVTSMPAFTFHFVADRPFFFAICDEGTGTILFMGAVFDPQA
jgi:serpin B